MSKEKISSQEIIDLVAAKASVSKRAADEFLKVFILSVEEALVAGEVVKIKNFGTFKLQWNEPRKSVNVQTGENIILSGYYKVAFTPDNMLRDQVNEPFAHLEAVQLDGGVAEPIIHTEPVSDPLRTLNEQAFEIKNILDEINGLSNSKDLNDNAEFDKYIETQVEYELPPQAHEKTDLVVEPEFTVTEDTSIEPQDIQIQADNKSEPIHIETIVSPETEVPINTNNSENETEIVSVVKLSNRNKKRTWLWVFLILLVGLGALTGLYFMYPPMKVAIDKITVKVQSSEVGNKITSWFTPKSKQVDVPETFVIPKDTSAMDSISEEVAPVDSLQLLFDNPRVYTEYIGSESIHNGSRLTNMAKRYYGSKDFWVYIYEANRENITDPDHIPVGTIIKIPKLDSKLIDTTNERCIQKAKELHDLYVK